MALMDILEAAHGGAFMANAAAVAGLPVEGTRDALSRLGPAIAAALKKKAENPEEYDALLDLLEDEDGDDYLADPDALKDPEALEDGEAILTDLYGSPAAAAKKLGALAGPVTPLTLGKLNAVAAVSVLSALARVNSASQSLASSEPQAALGGGGLLSTIFDAVLKGLMEGASRSLAPKRRRRRYTGWTRQRTTTRRRKRNPGLNDIFGEILGTRRRSF